MAVKKPKTVTEKPETGKLEEQFEAPAEVAEEIQTEKEPEKKDSFFVYIGPNILGVIQTASIYGGSRAEVLQKLSYAIEKYPRIKALLVDGEVLAESQKEVTKPGTRLHAEYGRLVAELKK